MADHTAGYAAFSLVPEDHRIGSWLQIRDTKLRRGTPDMRKKIFKAVLIRQRKPFRRTDGSWIQFEDNAAVILTPEGTIRGSDIKGPVAKEAVDRWARIGTVARVVV
jgi:large subunit ribosomal protein L14